MKIKLDYKVDCSQKRLEIVEEICEKYEDELTNYNLEQLGNYLVFQVEKEERRNRDILTPNRMVTVNKRETSLEGVSSKFKHNKDGVYNIMNEDKNTILSPKVQITKQDVKEIPFLKQIRESIARLKAIPNRNYIIQQAIIELSQSQYIVKEAYKKTIRSKNADIPGPPPYEWERLLNFKNWKVTKAFLHNYAGLRASNWGRVDKDMYWILCDFENLANEALKKSHPMLFDIMVDKIAKKQNKEIQARLEQNYGSTYSIEYISSLYNNKIPKLIADKAEEKELLYYYTYVEKGEWYTCNRCGESKLLHSRYFSKNSSSSRTGFYSICKECRNNKRKVH